ncbi:hypothetical protein Btru_006487 [Bulinus truncatus]|nr:hypothetical protein Btru_006487 [Bulinus truncatus]
MPDQVLFKVVFCSLCFGKPSAPQGPIEYSDIKADSVTLTWKPSASDGGAPIKNYVIERRDARKSTWTKLATVDSKTLSCTAQKLIEDTPYIFRVFAVNDEGQSEPLESEKELIPKTPAAVPSKPVGPIKFSDILADSVTLSWSPPKKDGGAKVTSYAIECSEDGGKTWTPADTVDAKTTTYKAKDLREGQKYIFRVAAVNSVGKGEPLDSDIVTPQRKITKPSKPTGPLEITDVQKESAVLTWKPPSVDGGSPITGYVIMKRDSKRSNWSPAGKVDGSTTEFKVLDLIEGTEYFFKVVAENKAGQSEGLETEKPAQAKSPFNKPSQPVGPLEISNVTETTADLSWKPPQSDGGTPLTSYIIESRPVTRSTWIQAGKVKGDETKFTVPDLRLDTEYLFRVIAVNAEGQSAPLEGKESARPTKKIAPPSQPQNLHAARVGVDYVTLEWKPPSDDGGSKVTSYVVEKAEEISGDWVKVAEIKALDTTYKVEHLKENVGYYFAVTAKNEAGLGEPCETDALIKPKKPEGPPDVPVGPIEISDLDKTTVTLTWKPPKSDGGSALTGYIIERREAARTQWTKLDSCPPTETSITTRNLIEGNEYYFRVCAENKHGRSDWLETDNSVKMRSLYEKPTRPLGPLVLSDLTDKTVTLIWKPPESDGGSPLTAYIIESRPSAISTWNPIGKVKGDTLTFTAENLKEGTEYHFRVSAVNIEGQGPALESKDTVKPEKKIEPPGPPTSLKASKVGPDYVTLEWKPPSEDGGSKITAYKIERCDEDGDNWVKVADVIGYDTSYKVPGLKDDKSYLFAVTAKNEAGFGEPLETEKGIRPKRPEGKPSSPVGPLKVKDIEKTSVTLTWQPPTDDGGSPLTGYVIEKKDMTRPTWTKVEKVSPDKTTFSVQNLLEGSDYQFRVSAENKHGASEPLATDTAVKPKSKFDVPSKPLGPINFSDLDESSVTLSWKPPSTDGGQPIKNYNVEYREVRRSTWTKAGSVPGDVTTLKMEKLMEGNEYIFRVTAVNSEGESQPLESLDTVKPEKPAGKPGAPGNLTVKETGKDFVKVEWSQPKSDGGSKITGYRLLMREDGSDEWKEVSKVGSQDSSFTFKDLSDKKKYIFAVVAENKLGQGARTETDSPVKPKKPATKPSRPVGPLKLTDLTRSSVTLTWKPSEEDGGSAITGYVIEYREGWKTTWSQVTVVAPDITSYCVQNLKEGQEYVFRVMAENSVGRSDALESDKVTPKHPFDKPCKPEGPINFSALDADSVTMTWRHPASDGGKPVQKYIIEYRDLRRTTWIKSGDVPGEILTYKAEKLNEGNEYKFRVIAVNDEGESQPLESMDTVKPVKPAGKPGIPSNLSVKETGKDFVTVEWSPPKSDGGSKLTGYRLFLLEDGSDEWKEVGKAGVQDSKYTFKNLSDKKNFFFAVVAENKLGLSDRLETDKSVKPKKPPTKPSRPVGPLKLIDLTRSSVTLTWKPSEEDGGSAITGYVIEYREGWKTTWSQVTVVAPDITSYCVQNLKEGQEYVFRVMAENSVGRSDALESDKVTPKHPFDKPSKPEGPISFSALDADSVTLTWRPPTSDGGKPVKKYIIEYRDVRRTTWIKSGDVPGEVLTYRAEKLNEGNEYKFRVIAVNDEGESQPLESVDKVKPVKPAGTPAAPANLKIKEVGKDFVTVEWSPPKSDGGSKITGYRLLVREDGSDEWKEVGKVGPLDSTYVFKSLSDKKKYFFAVVAENKMGQGDKLETESGVKPKKPSTKPSAPVGPIRFTEITRSSVTFTWKPSEDDGGDFITGYAIEYRESWKTSWSPVKVVAPDITSYCVQSLKEGQEYVFRVMAENSVGRSQPLESDAVKPKHPYGPPTAPQGPLETSDFTISSVTLSWQPPKSDGGQPLTAYIIERKDVKRTSWTLVEKVAPNLTSYTVQNLSTGLDYYFRVMAENSEGVSPPLETSATIKLTKPISAPSAPKGPIRLSDFTVTSVTINWLAPDDDGGSEITKYVLQVRIGSKEWTELAKVESFTNKYKAQELKEQTEYMFRVAAVNKIGQGDWLESDKVVLEKPPEKPGAPEPPLTKSDFTKTSITLTWGPSQNNGGSPILHYVLEKRESWKTTWQHVSKVKPPEESGQKLTHCVQGLKEDQDYMFRVFAENSVGASRAIETTTPCKPRSPFSVPDAPQGPIVIEDVGVTEVTIRWKPPLNTGGLNLTGYYIERRDTKYTAWIKVDTVKPNINSYCIQNLLEGNEYVFRIFAENQEGRSDPLETKQAVIPGRPAAAPSIPTGPIRFEDPTETSVTIDWLLPKEDGGTPITGHTIRMSVDGQEFLDVGKTEGKTTKLKVKDLKTLSKHVFQVIAENKVGKSKPLESEAFIPQKKATKPSKPVGPITVIEVTKSSVTIQWKPPADDGGAPLKNYLIEKRDANRTSWSRVDKISPDITSYCVQNLIEGSELYFRVFAENKVGMSDALEMDKPVKIKSPFDVPSAPCGPIKVSDVSDKTAQVSWKPPEADGGLPITGYIVQLRETRRATWTTYKELPADETSVTLSGLVPDNEYVTQVIAVNKEGHSQGLVSGPIRPQKILSVPSAPQSLHVRNIGKDNLTLEWSAPENDGGSRIIKYAVEKSKKGSDKWEKVTSIDGFKNFLLVSELEQDVEWLFAVSAENDIGFSDRAVTSKPVKLDKPINPPSAPEGPLVFSEITKRSARVSWKPSKEDGGSPITHYVVEKRDAWKTSWLPVERVNPDKLTIEMTHLQEGQEIYLRVLAENVAGQSKPLEGENPLVPKSPYTHCDIFTFVDKPGAPENLKATEVTSNSASLVWKPPSDTGGLPITSYLVERRDKRWGSWIKVGSTKSNTIDVPSLLENAEYFFRVAAENEEGQGPFAEMSEAIVPIKEPVAPERPVGPIRFSHIEATGLIMEWFPPRENGGSPITAYRVEVSSKQDVWTEVTITDADVTKIKVKDLTENQKVWFRVTAFNKVGASKPLESDSVVPQRQKGPPSPPTRPITVKVLSRDSVALEWGAPEDDGGSPITGYVIEKREALRMNWTRAEKTLTDATTVTVKNLIEGSEFFFRISAVNKQGSSEFLEMDKPVMVKSPFEVPSPPEAPLKILTVTQDSCDLEWSPSKHDGDSPILHYAVEIRESRRSMWGRAGLTKGPVTKYTARNLVINNEYFFRIRAVNAEGESQPLEGAESVTPRVKQEPPGKPRSISVPKTAEEGLIVEWTPPTNDGGSKIKKYIVQMKEDTPSSKWVDVASTDAYNNKVIIPGLDTNKKYKFQVAAENEIGLGDYLETDRPAGPTKSIKPPSPPENLRVVEVQRDSVSILWDHSKNDGGSPVTNYIVEKKESWKSAWAHVDRVKAVVTSAEVLYLTEGTSYEIRVMAENAAGISEPAVLEEAIVPQSPYKPPSAPLGPLEAKDVTSTTATITWKPPEKDGGLPIKKYSIERRDAKRQAWMKVDSVKPTVHTYEVTGLMEGNNYVFRVFAENAEGVSPPLESDVPITCRRAPEKPGSPSGKLRASKILPDSVTLDWLPPLDDGGSPLTAYIIEAMDSKSNEWKTVAEVDPNATRQLVRNLTEGETYRFRICAQNAIGRSKPVETDSTITTCRPVEPPGAPRGPLKAETVGKDSIKISWQPPLDDGGSPITHYIVDKLDIQRGGWVRAARIPANTTNCTVSGLVTDHDYNFRVYAENKIGAGEPLDMKASVKCKSPYNVPSAPRDIIISDITDESAHIEWSAPEDTGGVELLGYLIEKKEAGKQQWTRVGYTDPKTKSIKARNLLEGRPYTFRVLAENQEGLSEPLTLLKPITPEKPIESPGAPQNVECIRIDRDSVTLEWEKPRYDGGAQIKSYIVEKREGKAASWVPAAETDSSACKCTVKSLLEGYEYEFRVRAKNSAGLGEPAYLKASVIPSKPLDKPSAPNGPLEIRDLNEDSVVLTWDAPDTDGGSRVTNYIIEKSDMRRPKWIRVDSIPSDTTTFKAENLLEGVEYKFRVFAENKVGVSEPLESEKTVKPKCPYGPPGIPVGPIKTLQITRDSATIQWQPPTTDGGSPITSYIVERLEESKRAWMYCGRTEGNVSIFTCAALSENKQYYFRVYAENKYGRSKPLETDIAVIPKRVFEYTGLTWFNEASLQPYIDVYMTQNLSRFEYFYRVYADNPLSSVWDTIDLSSIEGRF